MSGPTAMDDERWEPGMPVLDRQQVGDRKPVRDRQPVGTPVHRPALPPSLQGLPARSVPEARPTPLQTHYVNLSVVVLLCGAVAISALELGVPLGAPLIKVCVIVGTPILVVTTGDAVVRIWRSAWAWMPVDRGKGLFRLAWVVVSIVGLLALAAGSLAVLAA